MNGVVIMYSEFNVPFLECKEGEMLGASDTLLDLPRNAKAVAKTNLSMMYLTKKQFETLCYNC